MNGIRRKLCRDLSLACHARHIRSQPWAAGGGLSGHSACWMEHCSQTRSEPRVLLGPVTLASRLDRYIRGVRWGASGRRWTRIPWSLPLLLFLPGLCLRAMRCLGLQ